MSYDFRLCLPDEGRSQEDVALSDSMPETMPDPVLVERRLRVARALMAAHPELLSEQAGTDADEVAGDHELRDDADEQESSEFCDPDPTNGIQVSLFNREAGVTVPYWHEDEKARQVLVRVWSYLETLEREGGYFTYDRQLGRVLNLCTDFADVQSAYMQAMAAIAGGGRLAQGRRSRWTAWFPPVLPRLPYFWRWCALTAVTGVAGYVVLRFTMGSRMEGLVLVPAAGWLAAKMLLLDTARLRSIGWSPGLTLLNLFPPAAFFLQVLLFLLSPRETRSGSGTTLRGC